MADAPRDVLPVRSSDYTDSHLDLSDSRQDSEGLNRQPLPACTAIDRSRLAAGRVPVYVLRSIRHEVQAPHRSLIRHPVRVATVAPPAAAPHDPGVPSPGLVRVRRSPGTARNPRQPDRWLQVHPPRRTPASSPARNAFASCTRPFRAAGLVLCRCVLPSAARDKPLGRMA